MSLYTAFEELSEELKVEANGMLDFPKPEFKIFGQSALIEANLTLKLVKTNDVDSFTKAKQSVIQMFKKVLKNHNLVYDDLAGEAWMPKETEYEEFFQSIYVTAYLAKPEYVLVSKALKAKEKNKTLITEYLGTNPTSLFFLLCEQYKVDLAYFVQ